MTIERHLDRVRAHIRSLRQVRDLLEVHIQDLVALENELMDEQDVARAQRAREALQRAGQI